MENRHTPLEHRVNAKYDVIQAGDDAMSIFKKRDLNEPVVSNVPTEKLLRIIQYEQWRTRLDSSCSQCSIYIPKLVIKVFVSLCDVCDKKQANSRKNLCLNRFYRTTLISEYQLTLLISNQHPKANNKRLLNYQSNPTQFLHLNVLFPKGQWKLLSNF